MRMFSANSNISLLTRSRMIVVEDLRFVDLPARLQLSMLEWMQQSEFGFHEVFSNPLIVGRSSFIFHRDRQELLNEGALRATLTNSESRFSAIREVFDAIGEVDRPRAYEYYVIGEPARLQLVALPLCCEGERLLTLTVDGW